MRYTTDLTQPVWFYMRGEEYSAQLDYFVNSIKTGRVDGKNSFRSALATDRIVGMIQQPETARAAEGPRRSGLIARMFR